MKALFRRAQAYRCKDSFEEALADIAAACKLDPTSTALRAEAQAIKVSGAGVHTMCHKSLGVSRIRVVRGRRGGGGGGRGEG